MASLRDRISQIFKRPAVTQGPAQGETTLPVDRTMPNAMELSEKFKAETERKAVI